MTHNEATMRYTTAKGYVQACKMIVLSAHYKGAYKGSVMLPLHMLAGFAAELYLKAWLLHAGVASTDVKNYGHKLTELFTDASKAGLPAILQLDKVISHLAGPHSDFTYRYIMPGDQLTDTNW